MTKNTRIGIIILVLVFIVVLVVVVRIEIPTQSASEKPVTVSYVCDAGKTITAVYYRGESKPAANPNEPPVPGGSVALTLSDGRKITLLQTISADGARYADNDDAIVFWSKGNGLIFDENNVETYKGCIEVVNDPGNLPEVYENGTKGFSIRYPVGYNVDANYLYQEFEPSNITGVKFTISTSTYSGTNLGSDTYVSVEKLPNVQTCDASLFLYAGNRTSTSTITDNDTTYSVASSSDAGAGNRYEETVYVFPGTNPCTAVRYNIHYGVIENYTTGTVTQFDHTALINQFDQIRRTLILNQ